VYVGVVINDCMMIQNNDVIYVSDGGTFKIPTVVRNVNSADIESTSSYPSSIGGYLVGKFIGKGAFGEVFSAEHQVNREKVALKFLKKTEILRDLDSLRQVYKEIQCMQAMHHQSIIGLVQHFDSEHHIVLAFELMEGGDLLQYMLTHQKLDEELSEEDSLAFSEEDSRTVFQQIVNGVAYAHHQQICHRDLKLENILLKGNTLDVVKIGDFGLSEFYSINGKGIKSEAGTLSFLAPEVFSGTAYVGPPLDVWSLGVILFTMLCGRLPFDGMDTSRRGGNNDKQRNMVIKNKISKGLYKVNDNLSPEAKDLIRRVFHLDPMERATMSEIQSHAWMKTSLSKMNNSYLEPDGFIKRNQSHQRISSPSHLRNASHEVSDKCLLFCLSF
jgi:serine/threonine protein kinase